MEEMDLEEKINTLKENEELMVKLNSLQVDLVKAREYIESNIDLKEE